MIELPRARPDRLPADPPGEVRGGIVVIQEIWGLADHIKDVADRFAAQGYIAVAPDLLGHVGLTPEVGAELQQLMCGRRGHAHAAQPRMREAMGGARSPEFAAWAVPALRCRRRPAPRAARGRRLGRGRRLLLRRLLQLRPRAGRAAAARRRRLLRQLPRDRRPGHDRCPVLAFYGEEDHGITDGVPELEQRMADAGVDFTARVYHRVGHAFFNDTSPSRYNAEAAADAWQRSLDFFGRHL